MSQSVGRRIKSLVKKTYFYRIRKERVLVRSLAEWSEQDEQRKRFYGQFIRHRDVCFDVGANVGNRTKIFLGLGAKVVAVEPQAACMRVLGRAYGGDGRVTLLPVALGAEKGTMEMMVNSVAPTISSMSQEWVDAVRRSGRFAEFEWDEKQAVEVTTLDTLVERYGVPAFTKIDVEGFEYEVLKGLTRPVRVLSLEFTPECFETSMRCVRHLAKLGRITANYSEGETMAFRHDRWVSADQLLDELSRERSTEVFGDIYVRFE